MLDARHYRGVFGHGGICCCPCSFAHGRIAHINSILLSRPHEVLPHGTREAACRPGIFGTIVQHRLRADLRQYQFRQVAVSFLESCRAVPETCPHDAKRRVPHSKPGPPARSPAAATAVSGGVAHPVPFNLRSTLAIKRKLGPYLSQYGAAGTVPPVGTRPPRCLGVYSDAHGGRAGPRRICFSVRWQPLVLPEELL